MSNPDRTYRCRALVGTTRCMFTGDNEAAGEHWRETGHARCVCVLRYDTDGEPVVCGAFLTDGETRTCERCITRTRDAIIDIRDADLEPAVAATALHPGRLPGGNALVMVADGNIEALRPYKPITGQQPHVPVWHPPLGADHPPYVDARPPADGREHYADHWDSDPLVPLPILDGISRSWRKALGEPPPDVDATVQGCCRYLLSRLTRAATSAPDFDEDAPLLAQLAAQVTNTAGLVNHPEEAPAHCFDCGAKLISPYREPAPRDHRERLIAIVEQRQAEDTYGLAPTPIELTSLGRDSEGREMVPTEDGLDLPVWQCADRDCARVYSPAEYWLAVRASLEAEAEAAG